MLRGAPPTLLEELQELAMEVSEYLERFKSELDSVVRFWLTHSHDQKHGWVSPR